MQNTSTATAFSSPTAFDALETMVSSPAKFDELPFGVVAMKHDGTIVAYNKWESELAKIPQSRAVGQNFFTDIAPCTNNFMVSGRYAEETELDETLPYLFTLRMEPTKVQLRLLKREGSKNQYLLVDRK